MNKTPQVKMKIKLKMVKKQDWHMEVKMKVDQV